jgi:hypothetical protein
MRDDATVVATGPPMEALGIAGAVIDCAPPARINPKDEVGKPPRPVCANELPPLAAQGLRLKLPLGSAPVLRVTKLPATSTDGVDSVTAPLTPVGDAAWITLKPGVSENA